MCSDWIANYENIQQFCLYDELQCLDPEFSFLGAGTGSDFWVPGQPCKKCNLPYGPRACGFTVTMYNTPVRLHRLHDYFINSIHYGFITKFSILYNDSFSTLIRIIQQLVHDDDRRPWNANLCNTCF
jgi:hypothetical protein